MASFIMIKTGLMGENPMVVAKAASSEGRVTAFATYCYQNSIAIKLWEYRNIKDGVGIFVSSQMNDDTNYTFYQVYQLPDWQGDPAQNFWVNDIGKFTWIPLGGVVHEPWAAL